MSLTAIADSAAERAELNARVTACREATEREPQSAEAWCNLASVQLRQFRWSGSKDEAAWAACMKAALRARRLTPTSARPHVIMGHAFLAHGESALAVERACQACRLDPENHDVQALLKALDMNAEDAAFFLGHPRSDEFLVKNREPSLFDCLQKDGKALYLKYERELTIAGIVLLVLMGMTLVVAAYVVLWIVWRLLKLVFLPFRLLFGRKRPPEPSPA